MWAGFLTRTHCLQGVMTDPLGTAQVSLCGASKQQEVVHALLVCCQLVIVELHCDNTLPLNRRQERWQIKYIVKNKVGKY